MQVAAIDSSRGNASLDIGRALSIAMLSPVTGLERSRSGKLQLCVHFQAFGQSNCVQIAQVGYRCFEIHIIIEILVCDQVHYDHRIEFGCAG